MNDRQRLAWLAIRLILGFTFLMHGVERLEVGLAVTAQHFIALGMPEMTGYIIFAIEIIAGSMMLLGIFPKFVTLIGFLTMLGSIFGQKMGQPYVNGFEIDTVLFVMNFAIFLVSDWKTKWKFY